MRKDSGEIADPKAADSSREAVKVAVNKVRVADSADHSNKVVDSVDHNRTDRSKIKALSNREEDQEAPNRRAVVSKVRVADNADHSKTDLHRAEAARVVNPDHHANTVNLGSHVKIVNHADRSSKGHLKDLLRDLLNDRSLNQIKPFKKSS